jgi:hypothetical protein
MRRLLLITLPFIARIFIAPLFLALLFMTSLFIILSTALAPCAHAQRMAAHAPHFAARWNEASHSRSSFYPLAFADPFYSDYLLSTGYPVASQPPVIFLQAPQSPPAPSPDRSAAPVQPLVIELRGDRYVRVSGPETSGPEMIAPNSVASDSVARETIARAPNSPRSPQCASASASMPATTTPDAPPAVLIFRDGHREETSGYTIANGILYTRGDSYATGSWTRKIELSSLNLPETLKSNQSRGVRFQLPSFPNEVIVRP